MAGNKSLSDVVVAAVSLASRFGDYSLCERDLRAAVQLTLLLWIALSEDRRDEALEEAERARQYLAETYPGWDL